MNPHQLVTALERERELLREFYALSEKQLLVLETEDLEAVDELLEQRSDLMLELSAQESNLSIWIEHIRVAETVSVSNDVLEQLHSIKEDIISLAREILILDDQTQSLLDLIARATPQNIRAKKGHAYVGGPSMTCIN